MEGERLRRRSTVKRRRGIRDIYKGLRKPVAPPTRVERDRRSEILDREDSREIEKHKGSRRSGEAPDDKWEE
jgi:hypothetical protein